MPPRRSPSAGQSSPESSNASESSGTGSQSSGAGENRDGFISIPFTLHRGDRDWAARLGSSYLEMPSGQENIKLDKDGYPKLVLIIKDEEDKQKECLLMMKNLTHENVLGVYFWERVPNELYIRVHVEPYTGSILKFINNAEFLVDGTSKSVPSPAFEEIVSASIDGLEYIAASGYYHGNFSWETTFYHQDSDKRVVKLANFEIKGRGRTLLQCQMEDYISLGASLEWASQKVKEDYGNNIQPHTCFMIDDLARILKSVTMDSFEKMKLQLKDHEFFWNSKMKKIFFAYDVPKFFKNDEVKQNFQQSPSFSVNSWRASWLSRGGMYKLLMEHMLNYRGDHGLGPYDDTVEDFLRFISGMYSHENEIRDKIKDLYLEGVVEKLYPRLFFDLKKAIKDAEEDDNAMVADN